MRISWKKGTWSFFVSSVELCILGAPFLSLFPFANLQRTSLVFNSWTVTGEETGFVEESDCPRLQSESEFWDHAQFCQIPPLSASLICLCLRPTQGERGKKRVGIALWRFGGGWKSFWCGGCCRCFEIPVHVSLCPAVTSYVGIWVLDESTALWPRGPVVLGSDWDESEDKTALSTPETASSGQKRKASLILSWPAYYKL